MEQDITVLKQQVNFNLRGEILFYELQNILKNDTEVFVRHKGLSKRNNSRDAIDISSMLYQEDSRFTKEALVLHLAKNSIYHNLPELLFHPLSVSNSTMSNKEIVEAVKENKETENDVLDFFMPFDNELFSANANFAIRSLHLFNDKIDLFLNVVDELVGIEFDLSKEQKKNLFIYLCEADKLKENLPELEKVLEMLLGNEVKLKYKKHVFKASPFLKLSQGTLGFDLGLCGSVESEIDDVEVTLYFEGNIDYPILEHKMALTRKVLEFFIISTRKVDIVFFNNYQLGIKLDENYLGINTIL
ncbi:hypothetical protein BC749_102355 [Flavobacterium araucananum]|uniref:Type VI secretion system baseplate subunit TssG n=1 Tax=Flavobacterium araucananum TaxID=946678 RepID=A0A227P958_9FLAO|nr:hypothetical protein [Flavobacterium araucananum]OXG06461.1 hypothetical protein B0A64_10115 [Flavobacterium araucananum]PWK00788.1 hypothetical protein BC749_102355 [Flavobacterium araucananum]